ncbi:MAG: glycosyltransferase family 25 protein [Micrococcales bacterium]|nr:glycosyltransferase family 25 protein [Micrococcales bacterium]
MRAYIINLDRSPERWEAVNKECNRVGLETVRIPAVDGKLWDGSGWKKQGRANEKYWRGMAGCYFSHIKAIETAIASPEHFPCLVLEDDVVFDKPPTPCGSGMEWMGGFKSDRGIYGSHAYCYNTLEAAQSFLTFLKSRKSTVDSMANIYRKRYPERTVISYPFTIHQLSGVSTITETFLDRYAQSHR